MRNREAGGFTLIEILVVIAILATIAGMVSLLIPTAHDKRNQIACTSHVRDLVSLLESAGAQRYPQYSGPNLLLYLVAKGDIAGPDGLKKLFCPGDESETFKGAGGEKAYEGIDLKREHEYGHLTSYAGNAQTEATCRASRANPRAQVLVCDDSHDHHRGGLIVGLTGGAAKFRSLVDDYDLDVKTELTIGEGSQVEELKCMRAE